MFLCFVFLPVTALFHQRAFMSVCLSARLSLLYLFIVSPISLVFSVGWRARLPGFTVKCSADWKGRFSNGTALPLIFCLSLGVRLIYHASSPADIQIHFDWRLDGMTPTATANFTAALRRARTLAVKCDTQSQVFSGYEYASYTNTNPLTFRHVDMRSQTYTQ